MSKISARKLLIGAFAAGAMMILASKAEAFISGGGNPAPVPEPNPAALFGLFSAGFSVFHHLRSKKKVNNHG